jgi:hypothetical protein
MFYQSKRRHITTDLWLICDTPMLHFDMSYCRACNGLFEKLLKLQKETVTVTVIPKAMGHVYSGTPCFPCKFWPIIIPQSDDLPPRQPFAPHDQMKMNKPNQVYFNKSISKMFGLKRIG